MFNITGVFTEQGPGSGLHRGAHICLRSSHLSWSSAGFEALIARCFWLRCFQPWPGLHNVWGHYTVMNNLAAESRLGWNLSDTFGENFHVYTTPLGWRAGSYFLPQDQLNEKQSSDPVHSSSLNPHVFTWTSEETLLWVNCPENLIINGKFKYYSYSCSGHHWSGASGKPGPLTQIKFVRPLKNENTSFLKIKQKQ